MSDEKKLNRDTLFSSFDKILEESGVASVRGKFSEGRFKLKRAPNPVVFIESPDFLDGPILFPEQYIIIRDLFEVACPLCNNMLEINQLPREYQVLFEYNVCPKCGTHKEDLIDSFSFPNTMIGVVGMRSGKSMCTAMICAAYLHEMLCLDDLQKRYGVAKAQIFDGSFAAVAGMQASETVWGQFRGLYANSPWYQGYKSLLMDTEIADPSARRGDLYWETDNMIWWKEKKLRLRAVTSNASTQAGRTRMFAVIDELSRFDAGASKQGATEVYRALDNSLLTLRVGADAARKAGSLIPDGMMICISSPIFSDDKSMRMLKDALKDNKMYSFHKATWDFNPNITKEAFSSLYEKDPVAADRDFGANPPGAENPFIKDTNIIDMCINKHVKSVFTLKEEFFDRVIKIDIKEITYKFLKVQILNNKMSPMVRYHIHCDPGETGDSFCVAVGHNDVAGKCIIDGAIEVKPLSKNTGAGAPRSVHFPSVVDMLLLLATKYKITVSYDKWNSTDQIHRLIDAGVPTLGKNLNRDDHMNMFYAMQNGNISFPAPEKESIDPEIDRCVPCAVAVHQLRRLEDNGVKVDHPVNGHNDMIQCYVGVHRALHSPDFVSSKGLVKKGTAYNEELAPIKLVKFRR